MIRVVPIVLHAPGAVPSAGTLSVRPDFAVSGPLVSCLMVSRGRLFPAALAIDCWRRQRYANRELVIVSAATDGRLAAHVAALDDPAIRFVATVAAPLGVQRNVSVAHARGDLVCTWDDDDLSAPDRLDLMVATLGELGAMACYLRRVTVWWPARRRLGHTRRRAWEPTLLARREALPIYPAIGREEDTTVARMIGAHHRVALVDAPDSYVYVAHGGNVCEPAHFETLLAAGEPIADYADGVARLGATMPLAAYAEGLGLSAA